MIPYLPSVGSPEPNPIHSNPHITPLPLNYIIYSNTNTPLIRHFLCFLIAELTYIFSRAAMFNSCTATPTYRR